MILSARLFTLVLLLAGLVVAEDGYWKKLLKRNNTVNANGTESGHGHKKENPITGYFKKLFKKNNTASFNETTHNRGNPINRFVNKVFVKKSVNSRVPTPTTSTVTEMEPTASVAKGNNFVQSVIINMKSKWMATKTTATTSSSGCTCSENRNITSKAIIKTLIPATPTLVKTTPATLSGPVIKTTTRLISSSSKAITVESTSITRIITSTLKITTSKTTTTTTTIITTTTSTTTTSSSSIQVEESTTTVPDFITATDDGPTSFPTLDLTANPVTTTTNVDMDFPVATVTLAPSFF